MYKLNRSEVIILLSIFTFLIFTIAANIVVSKRRGRDNNRKTDATSVQGALDTYLQKYKQFPESKDGMIVGCKGENTYFDDKDQIYKELEVCRWGKDGFEDLRSLPQDPLADKGRSYYFVSNTKTYQFFVSLEGKDEAEYTEDIVKRNLPCGSVVCNFGKSYGATPLNVALEEFQAE